MPSQAETPVRGDDTRAQLIDAGLRLFGQMGYQAVATRALAQAAGVNLAAIAYHFGGKSGLYEAVTGLVVAEIRDEILPAVTTLSDAMGAAGADRAALAGVAERFIRTQVAAFLGNARRPLHVAFVLREYTAPTASFPVLYDGVVEPMHKAVSALAGAAHGLASDDPRSILTAHVLIGQIVAFAIARAPLLRRMGWQDYTPERLAAIADTVVAAALAVLRLSPGRADMASTGACP
ncbi:MAG: CerR family C-terminal domain-containing protein [Alphaproteobacteria bacterium]